MHYTSRYNSPLGEILLAADEEGLIGLWFCGGKYFANGLVPIHEEREVPIFKDTKRWLDIYFSGQEPDFIPHLHLIGSPFRLDVWRILQGIPYSKTITYGQIAQKIASQRGLKRMSSQAVGQAVGHNPISIIIPCHRVVGTTGNLTGYAGGIDKKAYLLNLEKI